MYSFNNGVWNRNYSVCSRHALGRMKTKHYFWKGHIKTKTDKIPIFINEPEEDIVSNGIAKNNTWEPWGINSIVKHIQNDPSIEVIDCGVNLGVLALQLATLGRKVIGVEPTVQNTQHLCASIIENKFQDKITIVHNALSNSHEDVQFVLPVKGQFALGFVDQGDANMVNEMSNIFGQFYRRKTVPMKAAMLNDFLDLDEFKSMEKIFIKMDTQGFEKPIVEGSEKLFGSGKVNGVFIEWYYHSNTASGQYISEKFKQWKLKPFYCNDVLNQVSSNLDMPCEQADLTKKRKYGDLVWV